MKRLIDAEQAEKVLSEYYHHRTDTQHQALREALNKVPTAETDMSEYSDRLWKIAYERGKAEAVKRGKWIIRDNPGTGWYRITCSECGEDVTSNAPCIGFLPNAKVLWNYCPECGARMDKE